MQRSGKIIQRTLRVNTTTEVKVPIPRKSVPKSRAQDLFGPVKSSPARTWNRGGGNTSPHSDSTNATTAPTVSGVTGLTWDDGTDMSTTGLVSALANGSASTTIYEVYLQDDDAQSFQTYGARTREISIKNRPDSITDLLHSTTIGINPTEDSTEAPDSVQISFDNGNNYITLAPGQSYSSTASLHYFMIRRANVSDTRTPVVELVAVLH